MWIKGTVWEKKGKKLRDKQKCHIYKVSLIYMSSYRTQQSEIAFKVTAIEAQS